MRERQRGGEKYVCGMGDSSSSSSSSDLMFSFWGKERRNSVSRESWKEEEE
jgi:hypothetical protein